MNKAGSPKNRVIDSYPTEQRPFVYWLAKQLREHDRGPVSQLHRIVETCGMDFARQMYEQTLAVEARGGLLVPDGSRRRTIGGVYFYLVREALPTEQAVAIFGRPLQKAVLKRKREQLRALPWDRRFEVLEGIEWQGEVVEMKVTVIGFAGEVRQEGSTVIVQMTHDVPIDYLKLPSGTPQIELAPMVYTVYMAEKLWQRVEKQLATGRHMLRVMGLGSFDHETGTMTVLVTEIGTQAVKLSAEAGESEMGVAVKEKSTKPAKTQKAPKVKEVPAARVEAAPALPDHFPPDAARKLQELHAAAGKLRQKVEAMKISGMQSSLKMTERLLRETEQQIAKLEREYQ